MKAMDTTITASVTSAVELTAPEKKEVEAVIAKTVDGPISFSYHICKDVLGGIRVEVGDLVLDTTIASQLKKVKSVLS
jgi:F0F1-type ATP synthase delta subunit